MRQVDLLLFGHAVDDLVAAEQPIEPLFPALGFLAALPGAEPADEFLLLGDVRLLLLERPLLAQLLQFLLLHERRVIAGVALELALGQPDDPGGQAVEQVTVVADDDDRPAEAEQVLFQPLDGGQVQVIGRLVEQQQVGLADEQLGQRQPGALPAGQGGDRLLPCLAVQPDAQQRRLQLMPPGVSAGQLEVVLDVLVSVERLVQCFAGLVGHLMLDVAQLVGQRHGVARRPVPPRR